MTEQKMQENIIFKRHKHHLTSDLKLKYFGYGEWVEECDEVTFEYLGYEGKVVRVFKKEPYSEAYFGGHLCGYIEIPKSHPYFKNKEIDLDCHGGLTYNSFDKDHLIGFDCAHGGDKIPSMRNFINTSPEFDGLRKELQGSAFFGSWFNPIYRNMDFCIQECKKIIDQLVVAANKPVRIEL